MVASRGTDLDPRIQILLRRVITLRRQIGKREILRTTAEDSLAKLITKRHVGTLQEDTDISELQPVDPKRRGQWKNSRPARGPIAHLLQAVHDIGAVLDEDFVMHQHKEAQIYRRNISF